LTVLDDVQPVRAPFDPGRANVEVAREPSPLVIADGAFDDDLLQRVLDEWPALDDPRWVRYAANQEYRKLEGSDVALWSPAAAAVVEAIGAPDTIAWVAQQLQLPDPQLESLTVGGGYHTTISGGYLAPHADFNGHPDDGRWRRANVLLFLVRDYDPEWGGCLRLGVPGSATERVVEPRFNRLVAFETSSTSWHGHPDPWLGPGPRRSLAAYYFSPQQVPASVEKHPTRWLADEPSRLELEVTRAALGHAEEAAAEARTASAAADARAVAAEARAEALSDDVAVLEARIADLERSTSWRVTAPLRAATDAARAIGRR
jgi:hypothetical protein